jgi:CDP-diacylglycerol--serine O-phosphatidyltransferase
VLMPMFVSFEWGEWIVRSPYLNALWIAGIAALMISTIPTFSLKKFSIPHRFVVPTLLGIGLLAAFATTAPWPTLTLIGLLYIGSIPLTMRAAKPLPREAEAKKTETAEMPALLAAPPLGEPAPPPSEWRH